MTHYAPYFDGKRWHVDDPTKGEKISPPEGFANYADAARWILKQKTEELL